MTRSKIRTSGAEGLTLSGTALTVANGLTLTDGDVTFADGHGLNFAATGDGSGTDSSELLHDYEEGTFTPVAAGSSTAGTMSNSVTPTTRYTKIGDMVYLNFQMYFTLSGEAGNLKITGLPYACRSGHESVGTFQCNEMEQSYGSNVGQYAAIIQSGESHVHFRGTKTNGGSYDTMTAQNMTYIRVAIAYATDS